MRWLGKFVFRKIFRIAATEDLLTFKKQWASLGDVEVVQEIETEIKRRERFCEGCGKPK